MDMAVGLKGLVQVSSYIPKEKLSHWNHRNGPFYRGRAYTFGAYTYQMRPC